MDWARSFDRPRPDSAEPPFNPFIHTQSWSMSFSLSANDVQHAPLFNFARLHVWEVVANLFIGKIFYERIGQHGHWDDKSFYFNQLLPLLLGHGGLDSFHLFLRMMPVVYLYLDFV